MRPPLITMLMRTLERDRAMYPRLEHIRSPFGGTMATSVRVDAKTHKRKPHAGWDLYAPVMTEIFAITDGRIVASASKTRYGRYTLLEFEHSGKTLYAFYAHLTSAAFTPTHGKSIEVGEGTRVGLTGTDGNAAGTPPHLHFEIWVRPNVGLFPDGRINPGEVLGYVYENVDYRLPFTDVG